jgi:hypothetical protein
MELTEWITDYWEEHGFTPETTAALIRDIEEALLEHAISAEINYTDENQYD